MKTKLAILIILSGVLLASYYLPSKLSGGGSAIDENKTVKEVEMAITHGGYMPNDITVNLGDTVRILAITTDPSHNHGIAIDGFRVNKVVSKTSPSNPEIIEFIADKPGIFEIYCKSCSSGPIGSHPWLKGTLEVLPY
ncbi:MAG: cupredoxin domain-containing protein [Candidatus Aenigmarchaeota archaeon]|nr:cupredoxin domain-containing protein [Candidatus Aenigmarchaeota archaeon]